MPRPVPLRQAVSLKLTVLLVAFLAPGGPLSTPSHAQDDVPIASRIERRLKSEEPGWRFKSEGTGGKAIRHVWESDDERVTVTINELGSADEASDTLWSVINSVAMGTIVEVGGIGNKAYLIRPSRQMIEPYRSPSLVFIQDNVLVSLNAYYEGAMKRFASIMADEIKGSGAKRRR